MFLFLGKNATVSIVDLFFNEVCSSSKTLFCQSECFWHNAHRESEVPGEREKLFFPDLERYMGMFFSAICNPSRGL